MNIRNLTKKLPYPIKQGLKYVYSTIPLHIRYGKVFRETYSFLQESQWWGKEKLEEYQLQQLEKLLNHAYKNVPYYRKIFDERGLKPKNIQCFDDLRKLPYLTKDIIRNNFLEFIAQNYPKSKLHYVTTGGTNGVPLEFYWEKGVTDPKELAFVWRQWNWASLKFGDKRVILRGHLINRFKNGKRQWWEYDPIDNSLILSSYDMTNENLPKYIEKIKRFDPLAIQGYPFSLYLLARYLKNNSLKLNKVNCILTSSETLFPHQTNLIKNYLGGNLFDHYGNSERNVLIMQCEKGNYHIIPEYGITELIDSDGNTVDTNGEQGEIVGTGFNNYAMPFIRYKTGDIAINHNDKCECGRHYRLIKRIEGRIMDYIIAKDSSSIPYYIMLSGIKDKTWSVINQFQLIQKEKGKLIIKIIRNPKYSKEKVRDYFLNLYSERLKDKCDLKINFVNNIPRTKRGKHKFFIQNIPAKPF